MYVPALPCESILQSHIGDVDASIVGRIFPQSHEPVLLDAGAGLGNLLRILVGDAFAAGFVFLRILRGPPISQVALGVELAPLVVEAVNRFMSDDSPDSAVVPGVILAHL